MNISSTSFLEERLTGLQLNSRIVLWLHHVLHKYRQLFFNQEMKSEQNQRKKYFTTKNCDVFKCGAGFNRGFVVQAEQSSGSQCCYSSENKS